MNLNEAFPYCLTTYREYTHEVVNCSHELQPLKQLCRFDKTSFYAKASRITQHYYRKRGNFIGNRYLERTTHYITHAIIVSTRSI
jgi:hypothetical protein